MVSVWSPRASLGMVLGIPIVGIPWGSGLRSGLEWEAHASCLSVFHCCLGVAPRCPPGDPGGSLGLSPGLHDQHSHDRDAVAALVRGSLGGVGGVLFGGWITYSMLSYMMVSFSRGAAGIFPASLLRHTTLMCGVYIRLYCIY